MEENAKPPSILRQKYKENPFMRPDGSGVVVYQSRTAKVETAGPLAITETGSGQAISVAQVRRVELVDSDKFVKLYVANLDAFFDLKPGTIRVMTAVLSEVADARNAHGDTIYLNYGRVKEYFEAKGTKAPARPTFFSAMAEMVEKGFVAPSVDTNLWFINPTIFFNGDRIRFVNEYVRVKKTKAQNLEDAGQQALFDPQTLANLEQAAAQPFDPETGEIIPQPTTTTEEE